MFWHDELYLCIKGERDELDSSGMKSAVTAGKIAAKQVANVSFIFDDTYKGWNEWLSRKDTREATDNE